jgi:hypothetical protein
MAETLVDTLKKSFGLPDDATEDDITKLLTENLTGHKNGDGGDTPKPTDNPDYDALSKAIKGLRETNEQIQLKELNDAIRSLRDDNDKLQASLRLSEANAAVQQLSEGKGYVLPVPAQEKLLQILIKSPKALSEEIVALFSEVKEKGLVELEERGRLRPEENVIHTDDPVKQFTMSIERRMAENGLSYGEAVHQLAGENPALYKAYRNATFIEGSVR